MEGPHIHTRNGSGAQNAADVPSEKSCTKRGTAGQAGFLPTGEPRRLGVGDASFGRSHPRSGNGGPPDLQVFFAHSEAMRQIRALIDQAAATDATVLIEGESGAGKSLVAYALHGQSARGHRPLVKVNCTTLPAELLESELSGHERGAFTGAHRRKPGKFELAHEGTLFLDEVGELPPPLQAKLLQVLQDGEFTRLGGERDLRVDVRVLAATNRPLAPAVAVGTFRADLFYRLNVVRLEVPPLRARREEIPLLAAHFLALYAARYNRPARRLGPETLARFLTYDWPGNVRELENLVKRIVVLEDEAGVRAELGGRADPAPAAPEPARLDLKAAVRRAGREVERVLIQEALQRTRWNRAEAARLLQISYKALGYKMRAMDIFGPPA
jgi:two-component system response regulator AtoC